MKKTIFSLIAIVSAISLQACHYEYGGGGHWHEPHHGGGDHHGGHHLVEAVDIADTAVLSSAETLASNYSISLDSASKIINFADNTDNTQTVGELGLSNEDMTALNSLNMPSKESIQTIAARLHEDPATVEKIFADFIADIKSE